MKSKIESDYSKQQKQGQQSESFSFMWIKSPIQDEEETLKIFEENNDLYQQQFGNSKKIIDFNLNDILKSNPKKNMMKKNDKLSMSDLKEATNNVHAVYNFWRIASSFDDDVDNNYNDEENRKVIVAAFPDASFQTIRGLCEIIEWRNDNISIFSPLSTNNNNTSSESTVSDQRKRIVHAVMDQTSPIPVVVFTKETNDITPESKTSIQYNHDVVTKRTQSWVKRILVNHQICPFTKSVTKSGQGLMADFGVPIGRIAYHTSSASASTKNAGGGELILMADTFEAIYEMLFKGPSSVSSSSSSSTARDGISSILLSAPGYDDSFSLWSGPIFTMLESIVTSTSSAQKFIGVVCFHPYYKIPDENSQFPGFGQMHSLPRLTQWVNDSNSDNNNYDDGNISPSPLTREEIAAGGAWQRRSPHSIINVLRADQLEMAEQIRNTPTLYKRNVNVLIKDIGMESLQEEFLNERTKYGDIVVVEE
eukprot:CAMPEP_0178961878 /NCGR_PEP_ID=MMETSP0789-20121207/13998_1 /TAXON_ID=3005 /ORGANISM="Rhizosolenia setigera, Strain CCMP 1694" /LENGTH=478 /DNA_ID=CAMNT_0020645855 /DNA_START=323 /DNA_END=1762 /DNA_ORIENTATION=-